MGTMMSSPKVKNVTAHGNLSVLTFKAIKKKKVEASFGGNFKLKKLTMVVETAEFYFRLVLYR